MFRNTVLKLVLRLRIGAFYAAVWGTYFILWVDYPHFLGTGYGRFFAAKLWVRNDDLIQRQLIIGFS